MSKEKSIPGWEVLKFTWVSQRICRKWSTNNRGKHRPIIWHKQGSCCLSYKTRIGQSSTTDCEQRRNPGSLTRAQRYFFKYPPSEHFLIICIFVRWCSYFLWASWCCGLWNRIWKNILRVETYNRTDLPRRIQCEVFVSFCLRCTLGDRYSNRLLAERQNTKTPTGSRGL